MRLLLSMLAWPDGTKPEVRDIDTELAIGRGSESGWVLADPTRRVGRRHCLLTQFGDVWQVTDLSLNGTFINNATTAIGRDRSQELHDGDQIRIGAYVIEARYQAPASLRAPPIEPAPFQPVRDNPFMEVPGAAWQPSAWDTPPPPGEPGFDRPARATPNDFVGAPSADHSPAISDIWHPPPAGRVVLPDDWDLESMGVRPMGVQPAVAPAAALAPSPAGGVLLPDDWDRSLTVPPPAPVAAVAPPPELTPSVAGRPSAATEPLVAAVTTAPVPPRPAALPPSPPDTAALAAFWRGVGLRDPGTADPAAMMEAVGRLLRVTVERLRAVQIDRAAIKREFRILATVVRPDDNNPIKFSADTEAALQALLSGKRAPERVVSEMLDDIRLHELAMISAMHEAVRALLESLSPDRIRAATEEHGLAAMLPLQRKARAFEQYEALHARTERALADDFDSVFGKAFALAYERVALDNENTPERRRQ
jgi:type VI secretion system protein ImpI/type VI secretion system protein